jgi:hypothetical protein
MASHVQERFVHTRLAIELEIVRNERVASWLGLDNECHPVLNAKHICYESIKFGNKKQQTSFIRHVYTADPLRAFERVGVS